MDKALIDVRRGNPSENDAPALKAADLRGLLRAEGT